MSETDFDFSRIPVIDISDLIAHGAEMSSETVDRIADAARHVGFFSVTGHGCPAPVSARMIAQAKAFFALPFEEKMRVYIGNSRNHRGYVPIGEEVFAGGTADHKEAFDLSIELDETDPDAVAYPLLGPNQWPDLPGFADDVIAYYEATFTIGRRLMQAFAAALGLDPAHFDAVITKPPSQLRLVHYPFNAEARDAIGIGAHTDYECFTLLLATGPGLEVMNGKGEWIDAPPVPGGITINVGDMLELLSGGEFVATSHRVRRVAEERFSFPLFFNLDYPTRVAAVKGSKADGPELVAGEHLYAQTIKTFRYLRERLERAEIGLPPGALDLSSFGQEARRKDMLDG
jgi:isopenicillin N synthase-like dioxygenase